MDYIGCCGRSVSGLARAVTVCEHIVRLPCVQKQIRDIGSRRGDDSYDDDDRGDIGDGVEDDF